MTFPFEKPRISHRKGARSADQGLRNINIATPKKKLPEVKLTLNSEKGENWVEATLPVTTVSEANGGKKLSHVVKGKMVYKAEHWTDKHRRHKQQKRMVHLVLNRHKSFLKPPCLITLTRYAPKQLDKFDNLPMSLKWILDAVCEIVTKDYRPGRADSHEEIDVRYRQETSADHGVRIRIDLLPSNESA